MYQLKIKKSAFRELEKLPQKQIRKIYDKIHDLSATPYPVGSVELKGGKNEWRIRSGNYRIIYTVEEHYLVIEIIRIRHRKDIYR